MIIRLGKHQEYIYFFYLRIGHIPSARVRVLPEMLIITAF